MYHPYALFLNLYCRYHYRHHGHRGVHLFIFSSAAEGLSFHHQPPFEKLIAYSRRRHHRNVASVVCTASACIKELCLHSSFHGSKPGR